jgi:chemotaxis protein histidine kinase CheA
MDHGLEIPAERQRAGKAPRGRIEVELVNNEKYLEVFIGDDGQGLNLDAIRERAQERGLIASDTVVSDYEVASLISPRASPQRIWSRLFRDAEQAWTR